LYFAEVPDIVVSIPDTAGDPPSSFVQFGIQFQTTDMNAVNNFDTLEPIIKSQIMDLLMQETGATLQTEATRTAIEQKSLALANTALETRNYAQKPPFTAAYITSLVVQD
jgi:flagellar basal body-associated protein FliL